MAGKSALILGATGATGKHLLPELLASTHFSRVGEVGRRVTDVGGLAGKEKLEQKVVDFEKISDAGLGEEKWDVVYIVLGTTRKIAGSAEAFERIDREYVINAARAAKSSDPSYSQRIVYLSSTGADSSSYLLYPRSKGLTEHGLASLGYADTIIFRPGYLAQGERGPERSEGILPYVFGAFSKLPVVGKHIQVPVSALAKSIARAGEIGSQGLPPVAEATQAGKDGARFTLIGNPGSARLAEWSSFD